MARRKHGPKLPAQYAADLRRATRPIKRALTTAQELGRNPEWMRAARTEAAESEQAAWATDGRAIGKSWRTDLVQTGRLRSFASSPYLLKARVMRNRVSFKVNGSRVKYAKYHSREIYGWTPRNRRDLGVGTARLLARIARGQA